MSLTSELEKFSTAALQSKLSRTGHIHYTRLLSELRSSNPAVVARWYRALTPAVHLITSVPELRELVTTVSTFSGDDAEAMSSFCGFVKAWVTTNLDFLMVGLRVMVAQLMYQEVGAEKLEGVFKIVNETMLELLRAVPMAATPLFHVLAEKFPYKGSSVLHLKVYTKNLLCISEYAPELRDRILELIIDRLLLLDVEVQNLKTELEPSTKKVPFLINCKPKEHETNTEVLEKLDALLLLIFEYLKLLRNSTLCDAVFDSLIRAFDSAIINIHQSKYVQFLIFYCASFEHIYAETFLKRLMDKSVDGSLISRQASAQYLTSFVIRASFLRLSTRLACFELMISWLIQYASAHISPDFDVDAHSPFYSIAQAVFAVIAYHPGTFDGILESNERSLDEYQLDIILTCPLNPLRFCNPELVDRLAQVLNAMRWTNIDEIIEENRKLVTLVSVVFVSIVNYFPFNHSFELPLCSNYIRDIYYVEADFIVQSKAQDSHVSIAPINPSLNPAFAAITPSFGFTSSYYASPPIFNLDSQHAKPQTSVVLIRQSLQAAESERMLISMNSLSLDAPTPEQMRQMIHFKPEPKSSKKKERKKSQLGSDEEIFELND